MKTRSPLSMPKLFTVNSFNNETKMRAISTYQTLVHQSSNFCATEQEKLIYFKMYNILTG